MVDKTDGSPAGGTLTASFLFVDLVGSTGLRLQLGDDANDLLEHRFMTTLREAIARHEGEEVRSLGDGLVVAFRGTVANAVACAVDMQRSVRRLGARTGGLPLQIRIGLGAGEVAPPRGGAWSGGPVVEAARLVDAADPNMILTTDVVRSLVGSRGGFEIIPAGERSFQGFPDPIRCCSVMWEADPALGAPEEPAEEADPLSHASPYRGLLPFREVDASRFWGREAETTDLAERLVQHRFVAVIGASGSGKSSLLRAGLVPAIRRGAVPGGRDWRVVVLTPGPRPLVELGSSLATELGLAAGPVLTQIEASDQGVVEAVAAVGGSPIAIVVDQFEELFTACSDPGERSQFIANLVALAGTSTGHVAVAVRSDFLARCAEIEPLARSVSDGALLLPPISPQGIRDLIERPAEAAGIELEPGLVELMLRDVQGEPGSLPLLSHALYETWRHRSNATMTIGAYTSSGGVRAAIAATADREIDRLDSSEQVVAREILIRLTELGEGTEDTRRHETRTALESLSPRAAPILDRFISARLLIAQDQIVEVAHEALIREWPRLRTWLDADRERFRVLRHLSRAASDWEARGGDDADLYRGARLDLALVVLADAHLEEAERRYLDASSELAHRERTAVEREARERARQNHRLRWSLALLAVVAVVALGAAALAIIQSDRAANNEAAARERTRAADYQRLVSQSSDLIPTDRRLSALLAIEALRLEDGPAAQGALLRLFEQTPHLLGTVTTPSAPTAVAPADDGTMLVADASAGVTFVDIESGQVVADRQQLGPKPETEVSTMVAARADAAAGAPIVVARADDGSVFQIDPATHSVEELGPGPAGKIVAVAANPVTGEVAVATDDGAIERWTADGVVLPALPAGGTPSALAYLPGTTQRLLALDAGQITTWDLDAGRIERTTPTGTVGPRLVELLGTIVVRPDARQVVVFDPATGSLAGLGADGQVRFRRDLDAVSSDVWLAYTPDGDTLYRTDVRGRITEVDQETGADLEVLGQTQVGSQVALVSLDASVLGVLSESGPAVELWSTIGASPIVTHLPGPGLAPYEFSPDGATLLTQHGEGTPIFDLWDPSSGKELQKAIPVVGASFSNDHELGAFFDATTAGYYDLETRTRVGEASRIDAADVFRARNTARLSIVGYRDGSVQIYDRSTGSLRLTIQTKGAIQMSIRGDDGAVAVTSPDGQAAIYDTQTGDLLLDGLEGIVDLVFDHTGTRLYVATDDGEIRTIDASTGQTTEPRFPTAPTPNAAVRVDCCGRWLGAVDYSGGMRLYDLETGTQIGDQLRVNVGTNWTGALDPSGRRAAVQVPTGIDVFDLGLEAWVAGACRLAGRNLTAAEWAEYLPNNGPRKKTCPDYPG